MSTRLDLANNIALTSVAKSFNFECYFHLWLWRCGSLGIISSMHHAQKMDVEKKDMATTSNQNLHPQNQESNTPHGPLLHSHFNWVGPS